MNTVTDDIFTRGAALIKKSQEILDNTGQYSMADDGAVEVETGEFLYGLTRILKPNHVLTTGVYTGLSDSYIGMGLAHNAKGDMVALELDPYHLKRAKELWGLLGLTCITGHLGSSLEYKSDKEYELIFLDTEPDIRFEELVRYEPFLKPGGFIGIHDLPRGMCQGNINTDHPEIKSWPFGDIPPEMRKLLKSGELIKIHLPAPRGLVFFYKPDPSDYKI